MSTASKDPPESPLTVEAVSSIIANTAEPVILAFHLPGLDEASTESSSSALNGFGFASSGNEGTCM